MESVIAGLLVLALFFAPAPEAPNQEAVTPEQEVAQEVTQEIKIELAEDNITTATELLESLPEPEEKIKIAVYDIEDKTGQYKENGNVTYSRAVTQGATEMLITALMRSRQFIVKDRLEFQHVLNELNLKAQKSLNGEGNSKASLLDGAEYIIEGAITEYDVDRNTGGIGLKIAGKGASKEYAKASCAIDLRVTDITTGEVVWAKSLKKEILGEKIDVAVFSFMGENIVEFETGKGEQQAINLVVRTLLEEAVYKLAQSGIFTH